MFNWIKLCSSLRHAEQKLSRSREGESRNWVDAERERDVCAAVRMLNRNWADVERERDVCAAVRMLNRNWADSRRDREVCENAGKARPRAAVLVSWHFILPIIFSYLGLLCMRALILHNFSHAEQQYLMYVHYCKGRFRVVVGVHINKT